MIRSPHLAVLLALSSACGSARPGHQPWNPPDYWASEQFVEVEGLRLCYLEAGPESPDQTIVFVHGWSGNLQNWWDQFEHFSHTHRVLVFDLPGHGKSERGEHIEYSMELWLEVLVGIMDARGIERAHIVGNSAGGLVAARFAIEHPERVDRLVIADATGTRYLGSAGMILPTISGRMLQRADMTTGNHYPGLDEKSRARQAFVTSFAGTVEEKPYLDMLGQLLPDSYRRIDHRLHLVQAPTLVLWGDDDHVVPIQAMNVFDEKIPDSTPYPVHLGGHSPMMNSPDEVTCAMSAFFQGQALEGCREFALTIERRRAKLAGKDGGPFYE